MRFASPLADAIIPAAPATARNPWTNATLMVMGVTRFP